MRVLIAFLIVMCVGNATAADYEYWVDNTLGDNANSGSEGAPWETIRHATSTGLPNGMTAADTVTINIVPGVTYSNADDYIRPEATEMQGCSVVLQSATPGTPYVINGPAQLIWAITTCDLDLEIKDCVATVPRVFHWAGLTTPTANGVRLVIGESCTFTHSDTAAVDFVNFDSDSAGSSLELSGVEINGWASLGFGANLTSARITNITFNAGNCSADTTFFDAATLEITGCELTWPNKVNNVAQFSCLDTNIAFEGNRVAIASTNAANAIQFLAPVSGGSATVELTVRDNVFTGDATGSVLQLGRSLNTSADRATNDATAEQFASVDFTANEITNSDIDGGLVDVFVGCTGAKLSDNFMQVSTVGTSTNVHQVYIYAADVRLEENAIAGSILAFGPGVIIRSNVIAADRPILLGGTAGGSTALGGGNDYYITDNTLVALADDCYSDYAFNGTYGSMSNLGTLRAVVDRNTYCAADGAALALLTDGNTGNGWAATTIDELREVWQGSALSGGATVWGESTNKANDGASILATGELRASILAPFTTGTRLDKKSMNGIKYPSAAITNAERRLGIPQEKWLR